MERMIFTNVESLHVVNSTTLTLPSTTTAKNHMADSSHKTQSIMVNSSKGLPKIEEDLGLKKIRRKTSHKFRL